MSEPRRLLDEGGSEMERSLLRSARGDAPSPHARRRALIALGIGTTIVSASVTSVSATAASTGITGILKWIGIGIVGGGLVVGGAQQVMQATDPPAPVPVAIKGQQRAAARAAKVAMRAASPPKEEEEPVKAADEPQAEAPKATAHPRKAPAPSLADEVAQLDQARDAIAKGDSKKALDALQKHEQKFGSALLGPEAMVLRIEALAQKGDRAGAQALGNQFLAAYPTSPHANRVRSILAATRE